MSPVNLHIDILYSDLQASKGLTNRKLDHGSKSRMSEGQKSMNREF